MNKRDIPVEDDPQTVEEEEEVREEEEYLEEHLHSFMFDNEVSPANEGVNPLGRD